MSRMTSRLRLAAIAALVLATTAGARAETETEIRAMLWDACLVAKAEIQSKLDVGSGKEIDIVKSTVLDVTRLCTEQGAVAIGCSKADQTLIISVRRQQSQLSCLWRSLVHTDT